MERCLGEYGRIVQTEWLKTSEIRQEVLLGEFVVMPNHFHGILKVNDGATCHKGTALVEEGTAFVEEGTALVEEGTARRAPTGTIREADCWFIVDHYSFI